MFTWASIALQLLKAWNGLLALLSIKRERAAARNEAILEQKENTDAAIDKAMDARRDQRARNDAGRLWEDDPRLRD